MENKITQLPICFLCKNYKGGKTYKCSAFPDGIPNEILFGENDHSEPLPDQNNDIVFESVDNESEDI